jgi:hypothetical protein
VLFGFVIAILAIALGLLYRQKAVQGGAQAEPPPVLSDELIQQIERQGWIRVEEPLEQEPRIWEETWEEPDES